MRIITLATAFIVGCLSAANAASIVTNGDFETSFSQPGIRNGGQVFDQLNVSGPSWNIWTSIPGWTTTGGAGIEIQSNRTLRSIDAYSGSHYIELDSNNNSRMSQDVMLAAGTYELSFYYSPRTRSARTNGIEFSIGSLLAPETVSGPDAQAGLAVGTWTEITRTFSVQTAGTYELLFAANTRNDSYGGLLDTISITSAPGPAPVPLPAGVVLLASGLAGLSVMRRGRKHA